MQNWKRKKAGNTTVRKRYEILIAAHKYPELSYKEIGYKTGASAPTVIATLKLFFSSGFEGISTIYRNAASDTGKLKADGDIEARLTAIACSDPPQGFSRWTISMLTEELTVILQNDPSFGVESISRSAVGRAMTRNELRPHLSEYWCIPPEEDANFVAAMEDVLDVYKRPYDPDYPVWCMDEKPYQLLDDSRTPIPMRPGDSEKIDSEYIRHGTVSIFCFIQPLTGRIVHKVEPTRTAVDWAEKIKYLVDEVESDAKKIVLVMDNLNTHCIGSLYKAFEPMEARRIARKLEVHYTPKHGSWLNIAEMGINIITRQCLNQRIASIDVLRTELQAWNERYDSKSKPVNWQFTTEKVRIKLKSVYPNIEKAREEREKRCAAKNAVEDDGSKPNEKK